MKAGVIPKWFPNFFFSFCGMILTIFVVVCCCLNISISLIRFRENWYGGGRSEKSRGFSPSSRLNAGWKHLPVLLRWRPRLLPLGGEGGGFILVRLFVRLNSVSKQLIMWVCVVFHKANETTNVDNCTNQEPRWKYCPTLGGGGEGGGNAAPASQVF